MRYICDDGLTPSEVTADSAESAAYEYVAEGSYPHPGVEVLVTSSDGARETIWVPIDPEEPGCEEAREHNWGVATVRGGDNASVVICDECRRCGITRRVICRSLDQTKNRTEYFDKGYQIDT